MKSNIRQKGFSIEVNDIFDELSDENKRLKDELFFANNCLNILNELKKFLNKIYNKFETIVEYEDKQELNRLEEEFSFVIDSRKKICGLNGDNGHQLIKRVIVDSSGDCPEDKYETNEQSNSGSDQTYGQTSGETEPKFNGRQQKTNSKSRRKPDPKSIEIPEPENEPNSMLLLKRDNYDPFLKLYVCPNPECKKRYGTKHRLYAHFLRSHHKKAIYSCDELNCNKRFKTPSNLKSHKSNAHSDVRPFVCPVDGCGYRSKQKTNLNHHLVIHSDVRSYKCDVCHKTFRIKSSYLKHILLHSTEHKCRIEGCHLVFNNPRDLVKHRRIVHYGAICCDWPGCEFQCLCLAKYNEHKRLHTGELPYVCQWPGCCRRFRIANALYIHNQSHKNEKRYACQWPGCDYRANTSSLLSSHKKSHKKL